jgi:hypothetical protein
MEGEAAAGEWAGGTGLSAGGAAAGGAEGLALGDSAGFENIVLRNPNMNQSRAIVQTVARLVDDNLRPGLNSSTNLPITKARLACHAREKLIHCA